MKLLHEKPLLLLLFLTVLVYSRVPSFDFVNLDDTSHLDNNPYFQNLSVDSVLKLWATPHLLYMPMTYTVWGIGAALSPATGTARGFKYNPTLFHLLTLFFHLTAVLLLFLLLREVGISSWPAFWGSLLFSIHPVQAEAVSWVSGLKDTLSTTFFLGALYFFLDSLKTRSRLSYFFSVLMFLGALLSKPNAVVFPFVAFVAAVFILGRKPKEIFGRVFFFLFLSVPFALITSEIQATRLLQYTPPSFLERPLVALDATAFYLWKLVWPFNLAVDYGRTPAIALSTSGIYVTALAALAVLVLAFYFAKNQRASIVLFLLCLLPVLGFKPFSFQTTSTVSDRYLYLALFAAAFGLGSVLNRYSLSRMQVGVLSLLCLFWGMRTFDQTGNWKDTEALFTHNLQVNPKSWLSLNNLGSFYEKQGAYEKAVQYYSAAAEIKPMSLFYNNIATIRMAQQKFDEAIANYSKSISISPESAIDYNGLGYAWLGKGNLSNARHSFEEALKFDPGIVQARMGLMQVSQLEKKH